MNSKGTFPRSRCHVEVAGENYIVQGLTIAPGSKVYYTLETRAGKQGKVIRHVDPPRRR